MFRRRSATLAPLRILLLLAALPASAAEPAPPRALWTPIPSAPLRTAGSGEAPAVRVRLDLDELGRVARSEVLEIQPSGQYDALFRDEVTAVLSRWRFSPAVQDGRPVPASLRWTIQFRPRGARAAEEPALSFGHGEQPFVATGAQRRDEQRRVVLGLPEEQRRKLLEEQCAAAEPLLGPRRTQASGPHFLVITDIDQPGVADALLNNFEATYAACYGLLGDSLGDQPTNSRVVAYVFTHVSQYKEFVERIRGFEWSAGFYAPTGMLAFHAEMPTNAALLAVMLHETTHAFLDRHVVRPGIPFPRWFDEGFAEYVGNSDIEKGRLVPGGHKRVAQFEFADATSGEVRLADTAAATRAREARQAQREGTALTLSEIMKADAATFYGAKRTSFYAQSFFAVHFLRHGRPGWTAKFPDFLLYLAEGYPADAAFRRVYGAPPGDFEDEYQRYMKKF